ncbi:MAG: ATP cone domain-containing protein [Caldilineaceae bacterium]
MPFVDVDNVSIVGSGSPPMSMSHHVCWLLRATTRREPFDRQKLLSGIQTAATKRPISSDTIEHIVDQIVESLQTIGKNEVHSSVIGNMVLDHLSGIDQVAYIRFASVYLDLNDLNELQTEIDRLMGRNQ